MFYINVEKKREELLGQKYLAGSIQKYLIVPKTLLKSRGEFIDSFLILKCNYEFHRAVVFATQAEKKLPKYLRIF